MKQKICHVSPVSIHSTRWIEEFRRKGYSVSLITDFQTWVPQKPRKVHIYVLPTLTLETAHRCFIPNYLSLMKILKETNPDIVHLHTQHHYAPAIVRSRLNYILHSWGAEILELHHMSIFRRFLAKQAALKAQRIIVDAECMKEIWASIGVPESKVTVIPFGVNTNLFKPNMNGNHMRKRLGIREKEIAVISTRPFFPHYNIECLIRAIPTIAEKHKDARFIIKGKGPLEGNLKKLTEKLNVDRNILFAPPVPYHEMPQYLEAADIYVSTSFIDSTSVSLLEAMACGLPPITTDIPGNREWIENEVNGLLYPPKDHRALAEKIIQLIENEGLRKHFGQECLQIVKERATWEKCVSKMEAIYRSFV